MREHLRTCTPIVLPPELNYAFMREYRRPGPPDFGSNMSILEQIGFTRYARAHRIDAEAVAWTVRDQVFVPRPWSATVAEYLRLPRRCSRLEFCSCPPLSF